MVDRRAEALFKGDPRLPAEDLPGFRDVGLALLGVVLGKGFEFDLALQAQLGMEQLGKLEELSGDTYRVTQRNRRRFLPLRVPGD